MTATIAKMVNTDAKAYILPGVSAMTCEGLGGFWRLAVKAGAHLQSSYARYLKTNRSMRPTDLLLRTMCETEE